MAIPIPSFYLRGHTDPISALRFSINNRLLASGRVDYPIDILSY